MCPYYRTDHSVLIVQVSGSLWISICGIVGRPSKRLKRLEHFNLVLSDGSSAIFLKHPTLSVRRLLSEWVRHTLQAICCVSDMKTLPDVRRDFRLLW